MQIIGHRGSMATHPENTIPGFLHAMEVGADGVELDVVATPGGVLSVTHDPILDRPLHTLDEVLALPSPEDFWFDIEAKSVPGLTPEPEAYARILSAAIRRSARAHRLLVRSFDHRILRTFHQLEPGIPLSALLRDDADDWASIARDAEAGIISPHHSTVTGDRVRRAHEAGLGVSVWTVNAPADWERLAALDVDSIITDDPAAAVRYFRYLARSG